MNRRVFLATAGSALMAQERRLKLGLIGAGWYGIVDAQAAYKAGGVEFAAVADADTKMLDDAAGLMEKAQGSRPKLTKRYEEVLDTPGLDGVIIATPPHWHALPFIAACKRKLAVYMEKPLAYDIREGQAMIKAASAAGNIVQVGFQRRQSEALQQAADFIGSGGAGTIVQADVQIHYTAVPLDNTPQAPPPTLDWELWLGPAPKMPYSPNVGHKSWRLEKSIGNGHLVDWGIHNMDAARKALGLDMPKWVNASGGIYQYKGRITTPDTLTAHFEFDRCPIVWRHRLWGSAEYSPETQNGVFFYGDKATIFVADQRWVVIPREKGAQRQVHDIKPAADMGLKHMQEWLSAVRGQGKAGCTVEDAWKSTAMVQLGMIAYDHKRAIAWDAASARIVNDAAAGKALMRPYRAPYKHPFA
jgi:predicted dehydrogenase